MMLNIFTSVQNCVLDIIAYVLFSYHQINETYEKNKKTRDQPNMTYLMKNV